MPRKSYKQEEIVAKLRLVDVLTSQGQSAADAIRSKAMPRPTTAIASRSEQHRQTP